MPSRAAQPGSGSARLRATRHVSTFYHLAFVTTLTCAHRRSQSYVACVFPLQEIYAESIDYTNRIEGTSVSSGQLRLARVSQRELPVLTKGAHILVLSPDEALRSGERGERAPFWVAQLEQDEDAPIGKRS
jgi:hypothetical protein